jgi:hypothetical protein
MSDFGLTFFIPLTDIRKSELLKSEYEHEHEHQRGQEHDHNQDHELKQ